MSSTECQSCPPNEPDCAKAEWAPAFAAIPYLTAPAVEPGSCQSFTCEKVLRTPDEVYSKIENIDETYSVTKAPLLESEIEYSSSQIYTENPEWNTSCPSQLA